MPRNPNVLPAGVRLSDKLTLAQLHRFFPLNIVSECLKETDRETIRVRELPNEFMAYYPIMLCLYRDAAQKEVLRCMADGLTWLHGLTEVKITGASGISQARSRVGSSPLRVLFDRCAKPLSNPSSAGCYYKGHRLVALDGSEVDLDDCDENSNYFGKAKNQNGDGAYPKARVTGLMEIGTRATFALSVGKYSESELTLALQIIPKLTDEMLCLADRLFMSFDVFRKASETGANLLFRCREDRKLEREQILPDGSYISTIYSFADRKRENGMKVRVLEFDADIQTSSGQQRHNYRLITTLMDHRKYLFNELADLYHERWEFETMLDEAKTHLMGSQPLRSRTSDLVIQEIYGMFLAHYVVRAIMFEAAESIKLDPDELSFTHSKNVIERHLPKLGLFPPQAVSRAYPA